jgi:hypothetical protein
VDKGFARINKQNPVEVFPPLANLHLLSPSHHSHAARLLVRFQPAARVNILHAALCNAGGWTEQEALEEWLKTSPNKVKATSDRDMRTVRPSAPLCPTSHHRICALKPLPKRYSTPLCRSIRCLRHSSHACTVSCSVNVELQAALCAPRPEATVARCRLERHRVQHHQAWQVAFLLRPTRMRSSVSCTFVSV